MKKGETSRGVDLKAAQNRLEAVELRTAGFTYQQIGDQLGVTKECARQYVKRELKKLADQAEQETRQLRMLEWQRLEVPISKLWLAVKAGELESIDRWIKLSESRRKLLGLDKPQKIAPTDPSGEKPYESDLTDSERIGRALELLDRARTGRIGSPTETDPD